MRKNYLLDANILLHDPASIFNFSDNTVIIPVAVIEEIDRFKREMTARGYNARTVSRNLDGLRGTGNLIKGVQLPRGGTLKVHCEAHRALEAGAVSGDLELLQIALRIQQAEPETPCVIVTKDLNLRIRADLLGLTAEDYETDQVRLSDIEISDLEVEIAPDLLETFKAEGAIPLSNGADYHPNEYAMLYSGGNRRNSALARIDAARERFVALLTPPRGVCGVKPRNKEQCYAIDALLTQEIQLVTLMGKAGTGKTLLAMAAALHAALEQKHYRGVLIARPIVPVGRDMGYLPGQIAEKLEPWMKPIADTVDYLLDNAGPIRGQKDSASLLSSGLIEIQPLTYIRGRSIANRYVVIDEAQNLTPLEVKTVITRIGQDAKVVLTGDPQQIDNPYVDGNSNGFTYLVNRFLKQPIAAHVGFRKGERSALAELAANLL